MAALFSLPASDMIQNHQPPLSPRSKQSTTSLSTPYHTIQSSSAIRQQVQQPQSQPRSSKPGRRPSSSALSTGSITSAKPKPKPKRNSGAAAAAAATAASAALQDETQHVVNYPATPYDWSYMPLEHAHQVDRSVTIARKRYATSVDERHFLTVFEYLVNNQWIMWDYYSGYVHLTGLWKAIGNTKADIVKLVDNSPDLEPVIRRVRGGFLKIQGTWLPFDIAKTLASRTCYHIRYALIPLFGTQFPESCLKPDEPGFGQLQLTITETVRRRRKRITHHDDSDPFNLAVKKKIVAKPEPGIADSIPAQQSSYFNLSYSPNSHFSYPIASTSQSFSSVIGFPSSFEFPTRRIFQRSLSSPSSHSAPVKLDFLRYSPLVSSPSDFLDALQATKSLQLLASGAIPRKNSEGYQSIQSSPSVFPEHAIESVSDDEFEEDQGRDFECGGVLWRWDGNQNLDVVGYFPQDHAIAPGADQPRTVPDIDGLLGFANVVEETERYAQSRHRHGTPALSHGSSSPVDNTMRALSSSPKLVNITNNSDSNEDFSKDEYCARNVMDISGLLS
ncbi:hypothetical protein V1514DRAFT_333458 [Lipomyces japonicus]|uniref:uncharacterized protein n=1 Tax=Lipomyces japonicus TaxID=56871 RepID=UPI0034CD5BEE